jgi:hypothetical protein
VPTTHLPTHPKGRSYKPTPGNKTRPVTIIDPCKPSFLSSQEPKAPLSELQAGLSSGSAAYLAHVHNNHHFVLLSSWRDDAGAFVVQDPGPHPEPLYYYENITDIITYKVRGAGRGLNFPGSGCDGAYVVICMGHLSIHSRLMPRQELPNDHRGVLPSSWDQGT